MRIEETTTIAEIAAALPASIRVFQRHGIDFCCGGKTPLGDACRNHGLNFTDIVAGIESSVTAEASDQREWSREPLGSLIGHIVATYHQPLRAELPRLQAMARKVAGVHGDKAPPLIRVADIIEELAAELTTHMQKEEVVLFPTIDALEARALQPAMPLAAPITMMQHEHDDAGALLAELRTLTDGYEPPAWACAALRALYDGLEELEVAMHVHVHLENNILFPRALRLVAAA